MEKYTFIVAGVVSIITACITSILAYNYQKKVSYKFEYRSYILKKRIETYELILPIIGEIVTFDPEEGVYYFTIMPFDNPNPLKQFNSKLLPVFNKGYWLSDNLYKSLVELNQIVMEMIKKHGGNNPTRDSLSIVAKEYFSKLRPVVSSISEAYMNDIKRLDDIELFRKKELIP